MLGADDVQPTHPVRRSAALRRAGPTSPGLPAVVAALAAGLTLAPPTVGAARGAQAPCTAEFQPDTLTIRDRPARVLAELTLDIGEPRGVDVPARSGLQVLETRADDDGRSWILGVFLGDAASGAWTLELEGTDGRCLGTLTTRMPGLPAGPGTTGAAGAAAT